MVSGCLSFRCDTELSNKGKPRVTKKIRVNILSNNFNIILAQYLLMNRISDTFKYSINV